MSIINPWIFYVIDLIDKFSVLLSIVVAVLIAIGVVSIFILCDIHVNGDDIKDIIKSKLFKTYIILCILCPLLIVATPSKETMYTMVIANYVTYDNVETATDTIKDCIDYISDKFNDSEEEQ